MKRTKSLPLPKTHAADALIDDQHWPARDPERIALLLERLGRWVIMGRPVRSVDRWRLRKLPPDILRAAAMHRVRPECFIALCDTVELLGDEILRSIFRPDDDDDSFADGGLLHPGPTRKDACLLGVQLADAMLLRIHALRFLGLHEDADSILMVLIDRHDEVAFLARELAWYIKYSADEIVKVQHRVEHGLLGGDSAWRLVQSHLPRH